MVLADGYGQRVVTAGTQGPALAQPFCPGGERAPGYIGLGFPDPRRLALTPSASTNS